MDGVLPPLMVSSWFLLTGALLESLIQVSNEVTSIEKIPFVHGKNISTMIRRIRLLSSLFEEIQETNAKLPPSSILSLTELFSVIRKVKFLIENCKEGCFLWNLMQTESVSNQFYVLVKEMGRALDILPLSLLDLTMDTREQVELLHKQVKRIELFVDHREIQRRDELLQLMSNNSGKKSKSKGFIDFGKVREILSTIGLSSPLDYEKEISKLEAEAEKQAGTGGLIVVSNIKYLISLVSLSKTMIFSEEENQRLKQDFKQQTTHILNGRYDQFSSSQSRIFNIPDEFRCPISLDLMRDPVIVASGHTYD